MKPKEHLVQMDDFARKNPSPVKDNAHRIAEHPKPTRSEPLPAQDTECERLLKVFESKFSDQFVVNFSPHD